MMKRVLVRSRSGNFVLAFVGAVYAFSALALIAWYAMDVWHTAATSDLVLQIALFAAAACGIWFVAIALDNLRHGAGGASNAASVQR